MAGSEAREAVEDRDLLAGGDLHDRLLPSARAPRRQPPPLGLGLHALGPDADDLHVEKRLDRLADLRLVRGGMHSEHVLPGRGKHIALLRDHRSDDHLAGFHQAASSAGRSPFARVVSSASATSDTTSEAAPTRSATPVAFAGRTVTRDRFRNDLAAAASSSPSTRSVGAGWSHFASAAAAAFVEGSSNAALSSTAIDPRSAWIESALRSAARRALRLTLTV